MQLGMIGLGGMGANMVRRLLRAGPTCVVYDRSPQAVNALAAEGPAGSESLADLTAKLDSPRVVLLMVPAAAVDAALDDLLVAARFDRRRPGQGSDPRRLRRPRLRLGRRALDPAGGQRCRRARARIDGGPVRALRVARRGRVPESRALSHALRLRRPYGKETGMMEKVRHE